MCFSIGWRAFNPPALLQLPPLSKIYVMSTGYFGGNKKKEQNIFFFSKATLFIYMFIYLSQVDRYGRMCN